MSAITHFYTLAALDYVEGPNMPPWRPSFNSSYYDTIVDVPAVTGLLRYGANHPINGPALNFLPGEAGYTAPTVWSGVILDYVLALHARREAHEAAARLCGGLPHARNWVPGGVTRAPDATDCTDVRTKLEKVRNFLLNDYIPLALIVTRLFANDAVGNVYDNDINNGSGVTGLGTGAGYGNFLSYGMMNEPGGSALAENIVGNGNSSKRIIARGWDVGASGAITWGINTGLITEDTSSSNYSNPTGSSLNPASGETYPNPGAGYSWLKAPRYSGNPMEVGPLARMWVHGLYRAGVAYPGLNALAHGGNPVEAGGGALAGLSAAGLGAPPVMTCGISVMDRHRARAMEALVVINRILGYSPLNTTPGPGPYDAPPGLLDLIVSNLGGAIVNSPNTLPAEGATGYGLNEAPRGALGHWLEVGSAGRIKNYQCVVPTTWNGSPADGAGNDGPIEAALTGGLGPPTFVSAAPSSGQLVPVEALRVVRSFDPCIACAVHVVDAKGKKLTKIR